MRRCRLEDKRHNLDECLSGAKRDHENGRNFNEAAGGFSSAQEQFFHVNPAC